MLTARVLSAPACLKRTWKAAQHKSHNDEECAERGAIGVIVQNNAAGSPPPGMAGCDATITIRTVMITQADGAKFRDSSDSARGRTLACCPTSASTRISVRRRRRGPCAAVYAESVRAGLVVSHWDTSAFANLLMDSAINGDLTHNITLPFDRTLEMLHDIGW